MSIFRSKNNLNSLRTHSLTHSVSGFQPHFNATKKASLLYNQFTKTKNFYESKRKPKKKDDLNNVKFQKLLLSEETKKRGSEILSKHIKQSSKSNPVKSQEIKSAKVRTMESLQSPTALWTYTSQKRCNIIQQPSVHRSLTPKKSFAHKTLNPGRPQRSNWNKLKTANMTHHDFKLQHRKFWQQILHPNRIKESPIIINISQKVTSHPVSKKELQNQKIRQHPKRAGQRSPKIDMRVNKVEISFGNLRPWNSQADQSFNF